MVSNTVDDYLQRQIAQKFSNWKLKLSSHPVNFGHHIAL